MPLFIITTFILLGASINDHNSGGVKSLDEAKTKISNTFEASEKIVYSNLND